MLTDLLSAGCRSNAYWTDEYFFVGLTSLGRPQLLAFVDRPRLNSSTALLRARAVLGSGAVNGRWPDEVDVSAGANDTGTAADTAGPTSTDAVVLAPPLCASVRVLWEPPASAASPLPPAPLGRPASPPPVSPPPLPAVAAPERIAACSNAWRDGPAASSAVFNSSSGTGSDGRLLLEVNFEACDGQTAPWLAAGAGSAETNSSGNSTGGAGSGLHAFVCRVPVDPNQPSPPPPPVPPRPPSPPLPSPAPSSPSRPPNPSNSSNSPASFPPPSPSQSPLPPSAAVKSLSLLSDTSPEPRPGLATRRLTQIASPVIARRQTQQQTPLMQVPPTIQQPPMPAITPAGSQLPVDAPPPSILGGASPPPGRSPAGLRPPPSPAPRSPPARNATSPPPVPPSPPSPAPTPPQPPPVLTLGSIASRCVEVTAGATRYMACHTPVAWGEAVQLCSQLVAGGTLAVFGSQAHFDAVYQLLTNGGLVGSYDYWFGLVSGANTTQPPPQRPTPPLEYVMTDPRVVPDYVTRLWGSGQVGVLGSCSDPTYGLSVAAPLPPSDSPPSTPSTAATQPAAATQPQPPSPGGLLPPQPSPSPGGLPPPQPSPSPAALPPPQLLPSPAALPPPQPPPQRRRLHSVIAAQADVRAQAHDGLRQTDPAATAAHLGPNLRRRVAQQQSGAGPSPRPPQPPPTPLPALPRASGCCGSITASSGKAPPPPNTSNTTTNASGGNGTTGGTRSGAAAAPSAIPSAASGSGAAQLLLLRQCHERIYFVCQAPAGASSTVGSPSPMPSPPPSGGEAPGLPATTLVASFFLDAMAPSYSGAYRVFRAAVEVDFWGVTPDVMSAGGKGPLGQRFVNESVTELSRTTLLPAWCFQQPSLAPSSVHVVLGLTLSLRGLPRATLRNLTDFLNAALVNRETSELMGGVYISSWAVQDASVRVLSVEDLTSPPPPSPPAGESPSSSNDNLLIIVTAIAGGLFLLGALAAFLLYRRWQRRAVTVYRPSRSGGLDSPRTDSRFRLRGLGLGLGGGGTGGTTGVEYLSPEAAAVAKIQSLAQPSPFQKAQLLKPQLRAPTGAVAPAPSAGVGRGGGSWMAAAQLTQGSSLDVEGGGRTPSRVTSSGRPSALGHSHSGRLATTPSNGSAVGVGGGGQALLSPARSAGGAGGSFGGGSAEMLNALVTDGGDGDGGGSGGGGVRQGSGRLRPQLTALDLSVLGLGGGGEAVPASPPYGLLSPPAYNRLRSPSYGDRTSASGNVTFGLAGPQMAPMASLLPPPPAGTAAVLSPGNRASVRRSVD